jgi:hypothetical protein
VRVRGLDEAVGHGDTIRVRAAQSTASDICVSKCRVLKPLGKKNGVNFAGPRFWLHERQTGSTSSGFK